MATYIDALEGKHTGSSEQMWEEKLKFSREEFMAFWRSDDMAEVLTADDRLEIFATAPIGADDITAEALNGIINDYGVNNLSVTDEDNLSGKDTQPLFFNTIEEGKEKIIALYAKAEIVSREFADNLYENKESEFNASTPFPRVMGAIQAFRAWDWEDDEETDEVEIECEIEMVYDADIEDWDNEFHDYMYDDGSFVPESTRVGVEIGGKLVLDKGISYASASRRGEYGDE